MKYVYRIVNILLGLSIIPATLYSGFLYLGICLDAADAAVVESFSIMRFINIFRGKDSLSRLLAFGDKTNGSILWPPEFAPINGKILTFLIAFCLILVIALFIIIWSICSGKRLPVIISGALGIVSTLVMTFSFNSFAKEFVSGNINLIKILTGGGFLSSIAGSFLGINHFSLDGIENAFLFINIAVVLWTAIFYLVEIGDHEAQKEKENRNSAKSAKKAAKAAKKAAKNAASEG